MGRHVMEALGMSRVVMEDGKVVEVTKPRVRYCPLFKKHRGIEELNEGTIRENMEFRMGAFGMCCENRDVRMDYFLSFGISELMSLALSRGMMTDPGIVQGLGGRISAIMETSPIDVVLDAVGRDNVVDPVTVPIDMRAGVEKAFAMGHRRLAVTVASADDAEFLRKRYGDVVSIYAVHTTGISECDARRYYEYADVITACASKWVREVAKERATIQAGTKVPVYGTSEFGERIIRLKLEELGKEPDTVLDEDPEPLV